jgi:hypothetical protein
MSGQRFFISSLFKKAPRSCEVAAGELGSLDFGWPDASAARGGDV